MRTCVDAIFGRAWGCVLLALACAPEPAESAAEGVGLPDLERCDPVRTQDAVALELELELYAAIDELRASGTDCGARGRFAPAAPLVRDGALICAARLHSKDMLTRGYVDHEDPDGVRPWERLASAGYVAATADEVIAATSSDEDFDGGTVLRSLWLPRDGSCAALTASPYIHVGVGVAAADLDADLDADDENPPAIDRTYTVLVAKPRP